MPTTQSKYVLDNGDIFALGPILLQKSFYSGGGRQYRSSLCIFSKRCRIRRIFNKETTIRALTLFERNSKNTRYSHINFWYDVIVIYWDFLESFDSDHFYTFHSFFLRISQDFMVYGMEPCCLQKRI